MVRVLAGKDRYIVVKDLSIPGTGNFFSMIGFYSFLVQT
jgi:hypothetical protein